MSREATKLWKERNPRRIWAHTACKSARHRAKKKGVPFEITTDYVESILPDECPIFNTPFKYYGNKVAGELSPSLDRIDPAKGYVKDNIVVISNKANTIKSAYKSRDIFIVAQWLKGIEDGGQS